MLSAMLRWCIVIATFSLGACSLIFSSTAVTEDAGLAADADPNAPDANPADADPIAPDAAPNPSDAAPDAAPLTCLDYFGDALCTERGNSICLVEAAQGTSCIVACMGLIIPAPYMCQGADITLPNCGTAAIGRPPGCDGENGTRLCDCRPL